jgi:hypothetical protein
MHIRRSLRRLRRKATLWKRRHSKPTNKPTCPYETCPYFLSAKFVQRIQSDEMGRKVSGQYVCDYFAEGKPPGCGNSFVWLKEEKSIVAAGRAPKKQRRGAQPSFPIPEELGGPSDDYIAALMERRRRGDYQ